MTRSPAKTRSITLLSLWLLAFLGVIYLGYQTHRTVQIARSATGIHLGEPDSTHSQGLSTESQLLLCGDPSQESKDARWKALHESNPGNPLFYLFYLQHAEGIPNDFHQTIARIDPDNGWYSIWEVSQQEPTFKTSYKKRLTKSEREELFKKGLPIPPRTIEFTNLDTFHQHLTLLEKGLLSPRVDHYTQEIATLRFNALPPPFDFSSNINAIAVGVGSVGPV